jgi:hypothetical protein
LGRHAGAFKSEKRKKEIARQKKQEEKRQKRLKKGIGTEECGEVLEQKESSPDSETPPDETETEPA